MRPKEGGRKQNTVPSRFLNLANDFEFAGWGTISHTKLSPEDRTVGAAQLQAVRRQRTLGQFTASALAGNAVLGSVFYALPSIVAVAGVFSPISIFVSTLTLFLWRPIMSELAAALPISGAPYTYILNVSVNPVALISATLLLLDFSSTSVVSAATAVAYLTAEVELPFPSFVLVVFVFLLFTAISLSGIKESARLAFGVLSFHMITMAVLAVAAAVQWGRMGSAQLTENWTSGSAAPARSIARSIFDGICLGMLGLTGFECTPAYVGRIKPGRFPLVLRNLHLCAIVLDTTIVLFVMVVLPMETILSGSNILSVLAQQSAGRWLRLWVVVDAFVVLCGGILTGVLSACELFEKLAHDRVLPRKFLAAFPLSGAPYLAILSFDVVCGVLYASTGASLSIVSKMWFSLVWLSVMALFPTALLLLKFNRGRLPRGKRVTSLTTILLTLLVAAVVFAGNIAIDPTTAGYFAAYVIAIMTIFAVLKGKSRMMRLLYWVCDNYRCLHGRGPVVLRTMMRARRAPVCLLVKGDEINRLTNMLLYVLNNEETSNVKLVHFQLPSKAPPPELEVNAKILDEAFPEITIDLMFVEAVFDPLSVAALAHHLDIPRGLMFMTCPGRNFPHAVAEMGTRIICL
ncbi:hypothetical protein FISHEDRAFT_40892 [Fistulina hepatica ATCC 64428]|uniref:AAAP amino acid permease n=1 Tax=Fistulina hepatica ATCC 64428 TaxID=1128425 RepID=A0A0D7AES7_9AGAR|nr:hypothetical protein FISHEDRAFT_40892 [Fistulina hepatica ATCC 64428]